MDLRLTSEQLQLRDASRRLLSERLNTVVEHLPEPPETETAQALRDAQDLGWLGLSLPESVGGIGTFEDLVVLHEELGRGLAPSLTTTLGLSARLALHGEATELTEQLCAGTLLAAPALGTPVELTMGSRLHGTQRHVVDARAVTHLLVEATDGYLVQLVLVPTDAPGVTLTDEPSATDIAQCTVVFDDAQAPRVVEDAATALATVRTEGNVLAAARAVGGGRAVLDRTVEHVKTRHQFGRAIGTFQAVQHQLADVATSLDAAGLAVARAAWAIATGSDESDRAAAIAALTACEAFANATLVAHQLHGGMGFVLDSPLHLWSARAVADPTLPLGRRHLLDTLADRMSVVPQHRAT